MSDFMQYTTHVSNTPIHHTITVHGSKSITYRAILIAATASGVSELTNIYLCTDTIAMINALRQLGIVIQLDESSESCIIAGCNGRFPKSQSTIWCANSPMILRFLLAACAASPGVNYFDGTVHLRTKSVNTLLQILCRQGAEIIPNDTYKIPFTLIGNDTIEGGVINIDNPHKSQIVSSLLLISPYARSPFTFNFPDGHDLPHIELSCAMMAEFGVLVHRVHHGQLIVPVPQRYSAKDFAIEPDFSYAAYFFAAAALTHGEMIIQGAHRVESKQVDIKLLSILEKTGCHFFETTTGLMIKTGSTLNGVDTNLHYFSDAFAILCALAPFASTPTTISHLGLLNNKEQNRLNNMIATLKELKITLEHTANSIKIYPCTPIGTTLSCHDDHRIARTLCLIGLKTPNIKIQDSECVTNQFPNFYTQWDKLVAEKINT